MPVHLIKLAVGIDSVQHLRDVHAQRQATYGSIFTVTGVSPKRTDELLDGGSLYWVIKHFIAVRQPILDLETMKDPAREDGKTVCRITLGEHVPVTGQPRRPFQGWRYLKPEDAPPDIVTGSDGGEPPPEMAAELRALGLL